MARILIVDRDAGAGRAAEHALRAAGHVVEVAGEGRDALDRAARWQPDVVLLDVMDGTDSGTAAKLRVDPRTSTASVIALTRRGMAPADLERLTACSDDHLSSPIDEAELVTRVGSVLGRSRQARGISPLTGMPGGFRVAAELERLTAGPEPSFALLAVDIDGFTSYNQRYGFALGDDAIRATGRLIAQGQAHHRGEPTLAGHMGGDDFVVVTAPAHAEPLARWLVGAFDMMAPGLYDDDDRERGYVETLDRQAECRRHGIMTVSIGVATTARRPITSHWEAIAVAAEMRAVAQRMPSSAYAVDRRSTP